MAILCGIIKAQFNKTRIYFADLPRCLYKISRLNLRFFIDFCGGFCYTIIVEDKEPPKGDEYPISAILPRCLY